MSIPVPSFDSLPGPLECEARGIHAGDYRLCWPDATTREILDAWNDLTDDHRNGYLADARRRFEARLAAPAKPDDIEALVARLRREGGVE